MGRMAAWRQRAIARQMQFIREREDAIGGYLGFYQRYYTTDEARAIREADFDRLRRLQSGKGY